VSVTLASGDADPGIVLGSESKTNDAVLNFITALGKHRQPERETAASEL
jgi:catalase